MFAEKIYRLNGIYSQDKYPVNRKYKDYVYGRCTGVLEKTSCAHKWGQYTPALITTHLIQKYTINVSILQSCATQMGILQENFVPEEFRHHFAH